MKQPLLCSVGGSVNKRFSESKGELNGGRLGVAKTERQQMYELF